MADRLIDPVPIGVLFVLFAVFSLACYEIGFRVGRWWQRRMPGEQEGPADMLVGSLLALMAFLLAVTMGMASDRFDGRRGVVLAEANAMTAAYLQADYLPEPAAGQMKELAREHVPLRIAPADLSQFRPNLERASALRDEMWTIQKAAIRSGYSPDLLSSLGGTLTELATLSETRIVSGLYTRVPETVLSCCSSARRSHSAWSATVPGCASVAVSSRRWCWSWPWARS